MIAPRGPAAAAAIRWPTYVASEGDSGHTVLAKQPILVSVVVHPEIDAGDTADSTASATSSNGDTGAGGGAGAGAGAGADGSGQLTLRRQQASSVDEHSAATLTVRVTSKPTLTHTPPYHT